MCFYGLFGFFMVGEDVVLFFIWAFFVVCFCLKDFPIIQNTHEMPSQRAEPSKWVPRLCHSISRSQAQAVGRHHRAAVPSINTLMKAQLLPSYSEGTWRGPLVATERCDVQNGTFSVSRVWHSRLGGSTKQQKPAEAPRSTARGRQAQIAQPHQYKPRNEQISEEHFKHHPVTLAERGGMCNNSYFLPNTTIVGEFSFLKKHVCLETPGWQPLSDPNISFLRRQLKNFTPNLAPDLIYYFLNKDYLHSVDTFGLSGAWKILSSQKCAAEHAKLSWFSKHRQFLWFSLIYYMCNYLKNYAWS